MLRDLLVEGHTEQIIRDDFIELGVLFSRVVDISKKEKTETIEDLKKRTVTQLLIKSYAVINDIDNFVMETEEAERRIEDVYRGLTTALVLVFVFISMITAFWIARIISKSLGELTEGVGIIGKGNLRHQIEIESKDEIGELAIAFNTMAKNLDKSRMGIEKKVAQRTAELEKLNKFMVGRELKMIELKKELLKIKNTEK